MRPNLTLSFAFTVLFCAALSAQQVTIVNHFQGDTTGVGLANFRLSGVEEHRVVINYYEPAPTKEIDRLSELVGSALNFYIDQSVEVKAGKVKLKKSKKEILRDMNEIVKSAVKYYRYKEIESFKGFSDLIAQRIEALTVLDFDKSEFAAQATTPDSRQRLEFFYIQKHLNELKLQANIEVGNYGNSNLLVYSSSQSTIVSEAMRDSLLKALEFDPEATLKPLFTDSGMAELSLLGLEDTSTLNPKERDTAPDDFSSRVLELLERNTSKLDVMQAQIDQLRIDQTKQWQEMQESRNEQMQAQINDLRGMVVDLIRMNSGGALTSSGKEILTNGGNDSASEVFNIPASINLLFARGVTQLDASAVLALNEVVDILARNPELKLIITGYADKTGNAGQNLLISQERASTVKRFLKSSGLNEDRFITRYLGDKYSESPSADDRKVVIEFIR